MIVEIIGMIDTDEYSKTMPQAFIDALLSSSSLVRCADCVHWETGWEDEYKTGHYCPMVDMWISGQFYCGFGERRE